MLKKTFIYFYRALVFFLAKFIFDGRYRARFLNMCFSNIHLSERVNIRKDVDLYIGMTFLGNLYIGNDCFINEGCFIDYSGTLVIEDNVAIGMRAMLLTSSHAISYPTACGDTRKKTTVLKKGCWIGAGAIICPGVTIGEGSVIGAGEVVRHDVPDFVIYVNNKYTRNHHSTKSE
ncbi:DapH/DapD/GlmU-related protein [Vibrio breoganii]